MRTEPAGAFNNSDPLFRAIWTAVGNAGGEYADNAAAVIADPSSAFGTTVKLHWDNTAGPGVYETGAFNNSDPLAPLAPQH